MDSDLRVPVTSIITGLYRIEFRYYIYLPFVDHLFKFRQSGKLS